MAPAVSSTVLPETILIYCSVKGVGNAKNAFGKLESALPTLRGRKFYGHYDPDTDEYRACVEMISSDPDPPVLGFAKWTVPAGPYVYEKIMDWQSKTSTIASTVQKLIDENKSTIDWSRPILEYYRALSELRIMVPIGK